MIKSKSVSALITCLLLTASLITGCGGTAPAVSGSPSPSVSPSPSQTPQSTASAFPLVNSPSTLSAWWPVSSEMLKTIQNLNEGAFFQELEKKTGVKIDFIHPTVGQEQQTYNLMIASGDMPDMVYNYFVAYPGGLDKALADGIYIRLNELIDAHAPNYSTLRNSTDFTRKATITDTGNIMGLYSISESEQGAFVGPVVRKDWLDALGLDIPKTYDDWYEMLKAFRDSGKTDSPLMLFNTGFNFDDSLNAGFGVGQRFFQVDGTVKYGPLEDAYRDYLTLMNKWYTEGLINRDFFANKSGNGNSGAYVNAYYLFKLDKMQSTDPNFELAAAPAPVKGEGDKAHLRFASSVVGDNFMSVTTSCQDPELAVRWLDSLYSEEVTLLANYGTEGVTYTFTDGKPLLTDLILKNPEGLSMLQAIYKYLLHSGPMNYHWERELAGYTPEELYAGEVWSGSDNAYGIPAAVTLTSDEGSSFARIMSELETYVMEMNIKFIIGAESLDNYDAFRERLKSMGAEEALALQQAAFDRYNTRK